MPAWTNIFGQLHHHHDKGQEFVQAGIKTHFLFSFMSVSVIILNGVITIVAELPTLSSLSRVTVSVIFSFNVPSTTRYHTILERGVLSTSYAKLHGMVKQTVGCFLFYVCLLTPGEWIIIEYSHVEKDIYSFWLECQAFFTQAPGLLRSGQDISLSGHW